MEELAFSLNNQVYKPTHIHSGRRAECWSVVKGRASVSSFPRGRSKKGERPPRQTLQNAPPGFTSQSNLNLTMEPAQYACNPTRGPGGADLTEYCLLAPKMFSVSHGEFCTSGSDWMLSVSSG